MPNGSIICPWHLTPTETNIMRLLLIAHPRVASMEINNATKQRVNVLRRKLPYEYDIENVRRVGWKLTHGSKVSSPTI